MQANPTAPDVRIYQAKKFLMWLYIGSMMMIFAALTSAYLVRKAEGNWREFTLPHTFYYTTGIILLSSLTLQSAVRAARKDQVSRLQLGLWLTCLLALGFLFGQVLAYQELIHMQVFLSGGNPSESFLYVITGLHALHLVAGVIVLVVMLVRAVALRVHSRHMLGLQLAANFWHSLGFLWVYLFVFLLINHP